MNPIDKPEIFDSRTLLEDIAELEAEIGTNPHPDDFVSEREDLAILVKFRDEVQPQLSEKFEDGMTFVRDDYFEQYAIDYASDLVEGIDPVKADSWPLNFIDWKAAAASLQSDYRSFELDGETYWVNR